MDIAIVGGFAAALAGVCVATFRVRNRVARLGLMLAIPVLLVMLGVWWVLLRPDVQPTVWVSSGNAAQGSDFVIRVPNTRVLMTGNSNTFLPLVDERALLAAMREQHPATIITDRVAHVVENNRGYVLFPADEPAGAFTLEAEVITLSRGENSYELPFPSRSVSDFDQDAWVVASDCDHTCLADYYHSFTNVTKADQGFSVWIGGDTLQVLPQDGGYTIRLL